MLALTSVSLTGCTAQSTDLGANPAQPIAGDSVTFGDKGTLELKPSELREVKVTTTPGATVSFLILGDSFDASLDQGTVVADSQGSAVVTLKAPTKPSTFHVLATTGKAASDELSVAVSELGFASVRIAPKYAGGRKVTGWTASVAVGASCDTVLAGFPKDPAGALKADAPASGKPLVTSVPVGPTLAIAVRSGAVVWGCIDGTELSSPNTVIDLSLDVLNRPMVLGTASLTLGLEFSPLASSYRAMLDDSTALLTSSAFPPGAPAGDLLDAMRAQLPASDQAAFDAHRQSSTLDSTVGQALAADPRLLVAGWLTNVKSAAPPPSAPQITGVVKGSADSQGAATFDITALGPVPAANAGVSALSRLTWSAMSDDTLIIGGHFTYSPTRYVGALLASEAVMTTPGAIDASSALALGIDCQSLGPLVEGFGSCSAGCGKTLCENALTAMWQRGIASADDLGTVEVAASGAATVDDAAEPVSLDGSWVGNMKALVTSCGLKGTAKGQAAVPPN